MEDIEFSRQTCDRDENFIVVRVRMPRAPADEFTGEWRGDEARHRATRFLLLSSGTIADRCGQGQLAHALGHLADALHERKIATN